ncbi:LOW QUALITY PROTEIN: hypothetical protein ACHAXT_006873 [Thalassiosira profunda]
MECFDPSFFGISKAEAGSMAPVQRALLDRSYLALLDAGYTQSDMKGLDCGVFVGMWSNASAAKRPTNADTNDSRSSVYGVSGSAASIASGRISYVFDFKGPNAVYDTACSSSLVALDAAISALKEGKCEMALVAGSNELFDHKMFEACARAGMLSPTGRCHTWDGSADGYLRGEGCGAIVLKPAAAAKPASVYANLLGASVMSDGTSASITAPNGSAQEKLIKKALEASGIQPSEVDYIEAHGTGTTLGDPIEIEALAEVFASTKAESRPLMVGSVKSNIGHLEGAAGMAGLIKAVLVLAHESVPPNAGLKELNPLIAKTVQAHSFPVEFPTDAKPLPEQAGKLMVAGVSSFGYSGTIAHAIVRQAPIDMRRSVDQSNHDINEVFPNRTRLPWPEQPPHPLLQQARAIGSRGEEGAEYRTVFHDKLMELYADHVIPGMCLFPAAGFVEMGLAAGARMSSIDGTEAGVELLDISFQQPMRLERANAQPPVMFSELLNRRMEFYRKDSGSQDGLLTVAAIDQVNAVPSLASNASTTTTSGAQTLQEWKGQHSQEVADVQGRYARLAAAGYHKGPFQSIASVWLNERKDGLLGQLKLPEGFDHEHDAFYLSHPAVLDGAFQLMGFLAEVFSETESWVPAGISRVLLRRAGRPGSQDNVWARLSLTIDTKTTKSCNIDLLTEEGGLVMSVEGLRFSRLGVAPPEASMYAAGWIEAGKPEVNTGGDATVAGRSVSMVQLSSCIPIHPTVTNEIITSTLSLSDIRDLSTDELPSTLVIPLALSAEAGRVDSSGVLEECALLLQNLVASLKDATDGTARQICFWTCNAEGPWAGSTATGAETGVAAHDVDSLIGASVWGMVRSALLEVDPSVLRLVCVDTDSSYGDPASLHQVLQEVQGTDATGPLDSGVCYRGQKRFVRRLRKAEQHVIGDVELALGARGSLENLEVVPAKASPSPVPEGSVEVAVHAVSINFKDVLNVLVPNEAAYVGFDTPPLPGSDFAGIVTRVPNTADTPVKVGDRVYGLDFGMLRSKGFAPVDSIAKIPASLSFEDASALPMVFLTVLYALKDQAELKSGDRILIHSAAGGVGLAAVQYAQCVGADIYATASPSKHEYLRSIGVHNISTSRDEAVFASEMTQHLGEDRFDVVLSAGNLIGQSLDLLATGGCLLELGKRNILTEDQMKEKRPDVSYFTYTLNELLVERPKEIAGMMIRLSEYFESGTFAPLPTEVFAFQGGLIDAFKRLRDGANIGKVVVQLQMEPNIGTALITGGLGGLGLVTAELLLEMGAKHIVLVSRSGKAKSYDGQHLEERLSNLLELDGGDRVSIEKCDVSNEAAVHALLQRVREEHGGINTIVHASGALHDGFLQNMTPEAVRSSFGPKAAGAWYLHKHAASDDVRHFVLYSSIAAMLGNPGQANYSASNSYLDSLARLRRSEGLPATSIQWPAIADVGMAAGHDILLRDRLSLPRVKQVLKQLLSSSSMDPSSAPIPLSMLQKDRFPQELAPFLSDEVEEESAVQRGGRGQARGPRKQWSVKEIQAGVEACVRKVISVDSVGSIDHTASLMDMGLDSLGSTELTGLLQTHFGLALPSTFVFSHPTIAFMTKYLFEAFSAEMEVGGAEPAGVGGDRPRPGQNLSIVGMSCHFPGGVTSPSQYWDLIVNGENTSSDIPFDRWDASSLAVGSDLTDKQQQQVSHGSFVKDIECFDPSIFRLSKAEAEATSPLQRELLERSYLALLDAGYTPSQMQGLNCGVFVGTSAAAVASGRPSNAATSHSKTSVYSATGSSASIASGRISYVFDFKGPNAVYDTACSSSLVALDAAISALKEGKCDMALVAGANELFDHKMFEACARAGMLSPTGRFEFAGIVASAGGSFEIGDRVFGIGTDFFRSRARVPVSSIAKMPPGISFEEASALPSVFLTVDFALREQAQLKAGEKILIHSAAGGVGLAAIQYAQQVGAEIYATASPSKHDYLRTLGVKNVTTSRDEDVFASDMTQFLEGDRFDVVLSSGNLIERGEGCGAIVLKPAAAAKPASVYANLLGASVMSDGTSASITAPNGSAQQQLIKRTLEESGIQPSDVDYIEAHGTGTSLGDPIEIEALAGVFAPAKAESRPLMVGSVKSNIGHLEGAAGMAGLIKAVLVLAHESVPPNAGLKELNPLIAKTVQSHSFPVEFPTKVKPLPEQAGKLMVAGVSSFGYSGTIAHAIVRQAPSDMRRSIEETDRGAAVQESAAPSNSVMFLFTGQGSQYAGMGSQLYEENEAFREAMDHCDDIYKSLSEGDSLLDMLFHSGNEELVTKNAMPALIALEWSLAQMWKSSGVLPSVVLGHSLGEIAAACVAGAMTIETALALAVARAKLVHKLANNNGTMAAVRCSMEEATAAMASGLSEDERGLVGVASVNGPKSIVLSGARDVVDKVLLAMDKRGMHLQVSHAFHSPLMKGMEAEFRRVVSALDIQQPLITPLASTVAGRILQAGEAIDAEHWVRQLCAPVLFQDAFQVAMSNDEGKPRIMVEIGPNPVLSKLARSWWKPDGSDEQPLWAASLDKTNPSMFEESLAAVGAVASVEPPKTPDASDLSSVFPNRTRLPWPEQPPHPLLQQARAIESRGEEGAAYRTVFHDKLMELYADHVIPGMCLFPATGFVEMGLAAGARMSSVDGTEAGVELLDISFQQPMRLERANAQPPVMFSELLNRRMEFYRKDSGDGLLTVAAIDQVNAVPSLASNASTTTTSGAQTLQEWKGQHSQEVADVQGRYARLAAAGYHKGPFQSIASVWLNERKDGLLGQLKLPEGFEHEHDAFYLSHPAVLDGAFQLMGFLVEVFNEQESWVPAGISRVLLRRAGKPGNHDNLWARLSLTIDTKTTKSCNIDLLTEEGGLVMSVEGLRSARIGASKPSLPKAMPHTASWVEVAGGSPRADDEASFAVVQLTGTKAVNQSFSNKLGGGAVVKTVSDLGALPANEIPENIVVPVAGVVAEPSSSVLTAECLQLLQLLQSKSTETTVQRRVCFVTFNSEGPDGEGFEASEEAVANSAVVGGSVWGLVRTAVLELDPKQIFSICVDTNASFDGETLANQVRREVLSPAESEISYRGDRRFVRRLAVGHKFSGEDVELVVGRAGLESLSISPIPSDRFAGAIPDGSVEVSIYSTGLNFKDVLNVIFPDEKSLRVFGGGPGFEFAGIVASAGGSFEIGDRVFGIGTDFFRSRARVPVSSIAKMPPGISFEEASALPSVFLTVDFALREQAQLKAGEKILIHSAAGGVGLAAIQYAQHVGADIYATASPSKHDYLRTLGVKNVTTSRDEDVFASDMTQFLEGDRFDVVLSSGNLIERSVDLLANGGRFLEIAKKNIWTEEEMDEKRPDVHYFTYTFGDLMRDNPEQKSSRLESLVRSVEAGSVRPLPTEVFDFQGGIVDAFQRLRSGKTIGKVAVTIQKAQDIGVAVITGGTGGLGLVTAELLLEMGAEHVVLASRSGKVPNYEGQHLGDRLAKLNQVRDGAAVSIKKCDVSDEAAVQSLLEDIRRQHGKINTVIHSSGVLSDGPLKDMSPESLQACYGPKAAGAWYLHKHTLGDDISHFAVFSSVAGLLGNPRQANHSASNTSLDALIRLRRQLRLPGMSLQWPAVAEVGKAASLQKYIGWSDNQMLSISDAKLAIKHLLRNSVDGSIEDAIFTPLDQGSLHMFKHSRIKTLLSNVEKADRAGSAAEEVFLSLGENLAESDGTWATTRNYLAASLQQYLADNPSALTEYPHLANVLEHAKRDANAKEVPGVDSSLYDTNLQYRMGVDLYSDLPRLLAAPLREISLHPEHDQMYQEEGLSSSLAELAPLLRLACNEWHGTQLRVFEVGTGSGGLARRCVPVLEDRLDRYVCSDIFDIRLGSLHNHPKVSRVTYDVNKPMQAEQKYHLIVAANAIHIASNVKEALERQMEALEEGGYILLEEDISSNPLYFHGLDNFIWTTATDSRSYGLWMAWQEWLDVIDSVEGLELVVWHRRPTFVSMLLRKTTSEPVSSDVPPIVTEDLGELNEQMDEGRLCVYTGPNAEDAVKSLAPPRGRPIASLPKAFTDLDGTGCGVDLARLPLRFNAVNAGKLGAVLSIPPQRMQSDTVEGHDAVPGANAEKSRDEISQVVEQAVRNLANVSGDVDHTASLMDIGLDSLAIAELSSTLRARFDTELPASIIFSHPTIADLTNHLAQLLTPRATTSTTRKKVSRASSGPSWSKDAIAVEVERAVRSLANVSGDIDHTASLMDIGVDSLAIAELSSTLRARFDTELPASIIFSHPTIADLTNHLAQLLAVETQEFDNEASFETKAKDSTSLMSIVGMSCQFPGGVTSPSQYWDLIVNGENTSSDIPFDRWDASSLAAGSDLTDKQQQQVSHGSFVHDIECFDPSIFRLSKAETVSMSPLQRGLLACAYRALLDAGYTPSQMKGLNCGVFVGTSAAAGVSGRPSNAATSHSKTSVYSATGASASIASGRISYVFDFKGPNAVYDTACSSSLVALDAAISALKEGRCDMALVAGANELFDSKVFEAFARAGMLSPTGRCHTWDASADGFLRGEGCGAIVLKPAAAAKPASVYANLLGASVMSDGTSASITAPNGSAQQQLIRRTLDESGIQPSDVDYIEAHGTGTSLGDPIEIEALAGVFAPTKDESRPLMVGSVKSNIGHLEVASGMAGLIKAVLVLAHESVPPNAGLKELNPLIAKTVQSHSFPVEFPTKVKPLPEQAGKLMVAGVSSFGYSGTIAHAIVRQAPSDMRRSVDQSERDINEVFPNRTRLPWPEQPPHPLLQSSSSVSSMTEYRTVFHDKLMELYGNHVVQGRTLFPSAGVVEMGLAAGARMSPKGIDGGIELVDVKFLRPFDIDVGAKLLCNHYSGGGIEFLRTSSDGGVTALASMAEVNAGLPVPTSKTLDELKAGHTREVAGIQDRYARLAEAGDHPRGAFQSIESVMLSEDGKSALGSISLPSGFEHEHDAYYLSHPAVMDGAFQLMSFLNESAEESDAWVPTGIDRVAMHRAGEFHKRNQTWAHVVMVDDGPEAKTCNIAVFDSSGPIVSVESCRFQRLGTQYTEDPTAVSNATASRVTKKISAAKSWSVEEIDGEVRNAVTGVLCSADIDPDSNLVDAGLDSLAMVELSSTLRAQFDTELPASIILNNPTIADLTNHLAQLLTPSAANANTHSESSGVERALSKPRLLCLHGLGTNTNIASIQCAGLQLSSRFDCVFLRAPHESEAFPGMEDLVGGASYSWVDPSNNGANAKAQMAESLEYVASYIRENGPFDGVYAFSQASVVVTNLLAENDSPFKFALLACGGCSQLLVSNDGPISIPSFHIFGAEDPWLDQSLAIANNWKNAVTATHSGGHSIDVAFKKRETGVMGKLNEFLDGQTKLHQLDVELQRIQKEKQSLEAALASKDGQTKRSATDGCDFLTSFPSDLLDV